MNYFLFLWNLFLDHYIQNRRIVNANEQLINCLSRYWPYYFLSKYWENKQHFLSIVSNSKHYDVMALVRSLTLAEWWCRFGAVTFIRQYNSYPALRRQPFGRIDSIFGKYSWNNNWECFDLINHHDGHRMSPYVRACDCHLKSNLWFVLCSEE